MRKVGCDRCEKCCKKNERSTHRTVEEKNEFVSSVAGLIIAGEIIKT